MAKGVNSQKSFNKVSYEQKHILNIQVRCGDDLFSCRCQIESGQMQQHALALHFALEVAGVSKEVKSRTLGLVVLHERCECMNAWMYVGWWEQKAYDYILYTI